MLVTGRCSASLTQAIGSCAPLKARHFDGVFLPATFARWCFRQWRLRNTERRREYGGQKPLSGGEIIAGRRQRTFHPKC